MIAFRAIGLAGSLTWLAIIRGVGAVIIIYGSRLYGKVDVVPGLFHVETKFGHLWYFPLIPVETYLVISKSGDGFNGIRIPFSFKSVCYAWLRAGTLIAGIIASIVALAEAKNGPEGWLTPAIVGVSALGSFAVFTFHRGSTHASYGRACQLGDLVGLTPQGREIIERIYAPSQAPSDPFTRSDQGF